MNRTFISLCILLFATTAQASEPSTVKESIVQPAIITFGEQLQTLQQTLMPYCDKISVREIKPAQIPGVKHRQMQLDCNGFEMAGKKRLAEFVFKDDLLLLVWILVEKQELAKLESAMNHTYGQALFQSSAFSAYPEHRTALRKDVPEILFYSYEASAQFEAWFSSQQ